MVTSCSDVQQELIDRLCIQCEEYQTCAHDPDLDEVEFNNQLISCIGTRFVFQERKANV